MAEILGLATGLRDASSPPGHHHDPAADLNSVLDLRIGPAAMISIRPDQPGPNQRRVLVVDDHPVVRRGLRTMLQGEDWVGTVLEATTAAEAFETAINRNADVIVMDVSLPDGSGIDATQRIVQARPDVKVLILTMSNDEQLVERALRCGASGYLLKDTDPDMVVVALRTVANGGLVLGPTIGHALVDGLWRGPAELPPPFDQLTARERQILALLAQGCTNSQIGKRTGLSEKTIRNQLSAIFVKLGVGDRVTAALRARDARIA